MKKISIVTPVYNRADRIVKLYNSLLNQTNKNFEWIVIDDGSTDNIEQVIDTFNDNLEIRYIKKKNGGKCSALNVAIDNCNNDWFFVVDSDDYLMADAVNKVYETIDKIEGKLEIVGIVAYRVYNNNKISGRKFPDKKQIIGYNELNYHYNQDGETALIYRTEILKCHKHKAIVEENFLSEEIQYNELDEEGDLWILSEPLIVMEYLEDGLTYNYFDNWLNNSQGTKLLLESKYKAVKKLSNIDILIKKIKVLLQYDVLAITSSNFKIKNAPNSILAFFLLPLSYIIRKHIYKRR